MSTTAPPAKRQDEFSFEKSTIGGITLVTMHGTLSDSFEGRKLAASIKSDKILVDMNEVRRLASWGMSEWMDFLRSTAECDLYLIECSTYAVSQLNLVTGLMGHAKLISFFAAYRCTSCNAEMQTRFLVPRDRELMDDIRASYQDCLTCGRRARIDEYPEAMFDSIRARPPFDIDDEVLEFLRSKFQYDLSPDLTRFRAFRRAQKQYTYLRLTGNIGFMPAEPLVRGATGVVLLDVGDAVFDPRQLTAWRGFVQAALATATSLQLVGCPPGFLEAAVKVEDLRDKMKVRTFLVTLPCGTCSVVTDHLIDVAANLEHLVQGELPALNCPSCRSPVAYAPSEAEAVVMRALPARDRDLALDDFLLKSQHEPASKLDNALAVKPAALPLAPGKKGMYVAAGFGVIILGVGGLVAWKALGHNGRLAGPSDAQLVSGQQPNVTPALPEFKRPDWITSDVPGAGYCRDQVNRLVCVGVSSYHAKRDEGIEEASDTALDEMVNEVGLKISDPTFRDTIVPTYVSARNTALSALQAATVNRTADAKGAAAYDAATDAVRKARHRVVAVLRSTGGAAVPAQRSDWHWEEYAAESASGGTEFLVFVRYDVSLDGVRALVDKYAQITTAQGSSVMTAFPAFGWSDPTFTGGSLVTKAGPRLARAGIAERDVVTAVGGTKVADATSLTKKLDEANEAKSAVTLTVLVGKDEKTITVSP
ncbi:hypothetical protein BH11MYX1_BH11MYX1_01310 [soil metagenome]